jgi:hypothetical protein
LAFARETRETAPAEEDAGPEETNGRIACEAAIVNDGATAKPVVGPMNGQTKQGYAKSMAALRRLAIMRTL